MTKQNPRIWYKGPTALDMLGLEPPNINGGFLSNGDGDVELSTSLQSGLFVWFDADDSDTVTTTSTTSGIRVTSIEDKASGIMLYSNGPARPHYASAKINGRNGIVFNAYSRQILRNRELLTLDLTGPTTIVGVGTTYSPKNNEPGSHRNVMVHVTESGLTLDLLVGLWHEDDDSVIGAAGIGRRGGVQQPAISTTRFRHGSPDFVTYVERQTNRSVLLNNAGSGNDTTSVTADIFSSADTILFGGTQNISEAADWHGLIHEYFIWNRELSQEELDELHVDYLEPKYYGTISYPGPPELADISGLGLWLKADTDYMDFGGSGGDTFTSGSANLYSWRDAAGIFPEAIFTQTQSGVATFYEDSFDWAEEQGSTYEQYTEAVGPGVVFNAIGGLQMLGPEFPPVSRPPYTIFAKYVHGEFHVYTFGDQVGGARWNGFLAQDQSATTNEFRVIDAYNGFISLSNADVATNDGDSSIDQTTQNVLVIKRGGYNQYTYQSYRALLGESESSVTDNQGNQLSMVKRDTSRTTIGSRPDIGGSKFNGILYELMYYYGDLTDEQVERIVTYLRGFESSSDTSFIPVTNGLEGYWVASSGVTADSEGRVSQWDSLVNTLSVHAPTTVSDTDATKPVVMSGVLNSFDTIHFDNNQGTSFWVKPDTSLVPVRGQFLLDDIPFTKLKSNPLSIGIVTLTKVSGLGAAETMGQVYISDIERHEYFSLRTVSFPSTGSGISSFVVDQGNTPDTLSVSTSGDMSSWVMSAGVFGPTDTTSTLDASKISYNAGLFVEDTTAIGPSLNNEWTSFGCGFTDTSETGGTEQIHVFGGEMVEIAVYVRGTPITQTELDAIKTYWNNKYGLTL